MARRDKKNEIAKLISSDVSFECKGKKYDLVMTVGVLLEFEKLSGLSVVMDVGRVFDRPTLDAQSKMLYLLLREQGAECTLEDIQLHLVVPTNQVAAQRCIMQCYVKQVAVAKSGGADPQKPATA